MKKRHAASLVLTASALVGIGASLLIVSLSSASVADTTIKPASGNMVPQGYTIVVDERGSGKRTFPVQLEGRAAILYASCVGGSKNQYYLADVLLEDKLQAKAERLMKRLEPGADQRVPTPEELPTTLPDGTTFDPASFPDPSLMSAMKPRGILASGETCAPFLAEGESAPPDEGEEITPNTVGTPIPAAFESINVEMSGTAPEWSLVIAVAAPFDGAWKPWAPGIERLIADVTGSREAGAIFTRPLPRLSQSQRNGVFTVLADCTGIGYLTIMAYGESFEGDCEGGAAEATSSPGPSNILGASDGSNWPPEMENFVGHLPTVDATQLVVVPSRKAGAWRVQVRHTDLKAAFAMRRSDPSAASGAGTDRP